LYPVPVDEDKNSEISTYPSSLTLIVSKPQIIILIGMASIGPQLVDPSLGQKKFF